MEIKRLEIELKESPGNTILLGPVIGTADIDEGRRIEIAGSGKTLRFTLFNTETKRKIREFDLDLTPIAAAVVNW